MSPDAEPFFQRDGDRLVATWQARGPWKANSLHGRVIAGLLAAEIERNHGDPELMPVRLTVDMYRAPSMEPLHVETRIVRDGHRIKVIDADLISEGRSAGRATCQMLRLGEKPEGEAWRGDVWDAPAPDSLPAARPGPGIDGRCLGTALDFRPARRNRPAPGLDARAARDDRRRAADPVPARRRGGRLR
ncbi:thioesterase family protein [Novosphingobium sp. G106]|uniref:acyl-CoA thioesterase domain-containing protein n=1 Tax=Novosphingobium sp. G106 TaxID=2849500 RepID=UPI001C2D3444|nr:thioesterase family protein [Novosphingobium sp. G106]